MHKINRAQIYLILLVALILQAGPLNSLKIFGAKPDLMLMSVIFFGLFLGSGLGLESGLAAGILKDIVAFDFFFAKTLTLGLTGLTVGLARNKFFKESSRAEFLVVLFFTAFSMSFHYLLILIFSKSLTIRYSEFFTCTIIPACLYTGLVSIPLYKILMNVYNLKEADDYL
ncbi:MAG: rod shape-determining protein MreD [Candidatus Omnitrophota bacterium]|nr:rod shape-determining protein MreD [Candidatus Omnitrophota bacterium]